MVAVIKPKTLVGVKKTMKDNIKIFLFGDGGFSGECSHLAMFLVFFIYMRDASWTKIDPMAFFGFVVVIMISRLFTDCNTYGEKIFYVLFLATICASAYLQDLLSDHDCTYCMTNFPTTVKNFVLPEPGQPSMDFWSLFDDEDDAPRLCAKCMLSVSSALKWIGHVPDFVKDLDGDMFDSLDNYAGLMGATTNSDMYNGTYAHNMYPNISDPSALSPTEIRKLDEWYAAIKKDTAPKDAFKKFIRALAADMDDTERTEKIASMMHDILCYPSSRMTGPKPSEYIQNVKEPRITGEENVEGDGPMKISFDKLVAIMRGDMMQSLHPDVCTMMRLADFIIQEDDTVLTHSMNAASLGPLANETALAGHDVGLLFPGLYVMKVDEDKDPDGSASSMTEAFIKLFVGIPMIDDAKWFETREEYLAWFRWLVEHKVQDEYYFPRWLSRIEGSAEVKSVIDEVGELVATQATANGDRQRVFEPTSDTTLVDRALYGAGAKTLAAVVLPGDPSYGYLLDPAYYITEAEQEFFQNEAMPSEEDFLRMATVAWGHEVTDIESLRDRVVQIDYTIATHFQTREMYETNGSILYLDADTRKPIGIWLPCREKVVLPNAAESWEEAKFIHRSTEVVVAAILHVGEYHLGWANRFNAALRQTLPTQHGLRSLMKPHAHGTGIVNWNAYQMLVVDDSMLARANGLTNLARGYSWGHLVKHSDMVSTLPQILEAKGLQNTSNLTTTLPYYVQGKRLWDIHHEYVEKFVNLIFESDNDLKEDEALQRFWHHINTNGRHIDPCICDMDAEIFFKEDQWPAFESTRTCAGQLDHAGFRTDDTDPEHRRASWCKQALPTERSRALHSWLETDCEKQAICEQVSFRVEHLRVNMGLPELSRENLINLITRFIYEVTAGHELVADNLPFIVDPMYGGVRRLKREYIDESKPPMADVSTWVYGTVISALTTIRSVPLLADWSGLLDSWVNNEADWRRLSDTDRAERKSILSTMHFEYKSKLIKNANLFLKESLQRPKNQWCNFLNPAVQATSIAV